MIEKRKTDIACKHSLHIRTFGHFECFIDGLPARFRYRKTKEMLAYLIDRRGAMVSDREMRVILWQDKEGRQSYIKSLKADLNRVFGEAGLEESIISQRGLIGVAAEMIDCDLYDLIIWRKPAFGRYWGEYMTQYSWSSDTRRQLDDIYDLEVMDLEKLRSPA